MFSRLQVPSVGDKPHQPVSISKKRIWKKLIVKRSFLPCWFQRCLRYATTKKMTLRFALCVWRLTLKINWTQKSESMNQLYISSGYSNWKNACAKFPNHEASTCYNDAVLKTVTLPATTWDIGKSLSSQLAKEILQRQQCFWNYCPMCNFWLDKPCHFKVVEMNLIPIICNC